MEPANPDNKVLLKQLLGILRALHWSHWTSHWQVRGDTSYGDHLLFERLYTAITDEIDALAEKIVSYYGAEAVSALPSMEFSEDFLALYDETTDVYKRALLMETHFQNAAKKVYETLKGMDEMTLGLDDYIMSIANTHETHQYLLRQRLRPGRVASLTYDDLKKAAKKAGTAWVSGLKKIKPKPASVTLVKSVPGSVPGWDYSLYTLVEVAMGTNPVRIAVSISVKEGAEASGYVQGDAPYGMISTFRGKDYESVSKKLLADAVDHLSA